jgi:predicted hydrocarbon binding protein
MEQNEHLRAWLSGLMATLTARQSVDILKACGRACADSHGVQEAVAQVLATLQNPGDIDALLEAMNQRHIAGGHLRREDDLIVGSYERCYCPLREAGLVESPFFCHCTRGFADRAFETALGRPVKIDLRKAIAWGDDECEFVVRY